MEIRVEQGCPQCGARIALAETDRILTCEYCGVKNLLQPRERELFRYIIPPRIKPPDETSYLLVPYLRFKGTIFLVTANSITHKVVDTTQVAVGGGGLPPSLGVRPQAMQLRRVEPSLPAEYLLRSLAPLTVLEKAIQVSGLSIEKGKGLIHRAFIGESISLIYLPLIRKGDQCIDAVSRARVRLPLQSGQGQQKQRVTAFHPRWKINYLATLCPHCGWNLDGSVDTTVMHCDNCRRAWDISVNPIKQVQWFAAPDKGCGLMLPFWRISCRIDALGIVTFKDFVRCLGLHVPHLSSCGSSKMSFLVPGFKIRPKIFLQAARGATLGQCSLRFSAGTTNGSCHPVTLSSAEARQSVKVLLASSTVRKINVYPFLPKAKLDDPVFDLIYMPFADRGHDWVQPETGITIAKSVLRFGRSM